MPARIGDKRSRQKYGTRYGAPTGQPGSGAAQGKRKYGSGRDTARVQISLGSNSWHAKIHSKSMIPQPRRHSKHTRHTEVGKNLGTQDSVYLCTHILSQAVTAARGGQGRPGGPAIWQTLSVVRYYDVCATTLHGLDGSAVHSPVGACDLADLVSCSIL